MWGARCAAFEREQAPLWQPAVQPSTPHLRAAGVGEAPRCGGQQLLLLCIEGSCLAQLATQGCLKARAVRICGPVASRRRQ